MAGFIKLDRSIFTHWIFQDAEKFRAFVDLIQLARWKDEKLIIGNELVDIPRGSYYTSELKLAERWGWSRNKTREYLKLLESEGMITKKGTTKGTTLTIENYRFYQDKGTTKGTSNEQPKDNERTTEGTSNRQQKDNERYTKEERKEGEENKECKEGEEGEEITPPSPPPLSIPTKYHELILDQWSEIAYKTWFMDSEIVEDGQELKIIVDSELRANAINQKYSRHLGTLLGKNIRIEIREEI